MYGILKSVQGVKEKINVNSINAPWYFFCNDQNLRLSHRVELQFKFALQK